MFSFSANNFDNKNQNLLGHRNLAFLAENEALQQTTTSNLNCLEHKQYFWYQFLMLGTLGKRKSYYYKTKAQSDWIMASLHKRKNWKHLYFLCLVQLLMVLSQWVYPLNFALPYILKINKNVKNTNFWFIFSENCCSWPFWNSQRKIAFEHLLNFETPGTGHQFFELMCISRKHLTKNYLRDTKRQVMITFSQICSLLWSIWSPSCTMLEMRLYVPGMSTWQKTATLSPSPAGVSLPPAFQGKRKEVCVESLSTKRYPSFGFGDALSELP